MAELIQSLTKGQSGQVQEVRINSGDVVQTADEAEVVVNLVQVLQML